MAADTLNARITRRYIALVALSMTLMGILVLFTIRAYTIREAKTELQKSTRIISELAGGQLNNEATLNEFILEQLIRDRFRRGVEFRAYGYTMAIVDREGRLLLPRTGQDLIFLTTKALPALWNRILAKQPYESGFEYFKADGVQYICSVLPTENIFVLLYLPIKSIQGITGGLILLIVLLVGCSCAVAAIVGKMMASSISRPIIQMKNATKDIARRKFDNLPVITTGDELEDLAGSIRSMSEELKNYDLSQKTFLQNVSHELKTPLMSIQGYAEGIKDGVFKDEAVTRALDVVVDESMRLKNIVEELVYLTKLETMEDFFRPDLENIMELVEESVEKVRGLALTEGKNIEISPGDPAVLTLDRDKIIQALMNILGNCLRHASSRVWVDTGLNRGGFYEIHVHDDGPGFTPEDLKNAFKRFYKGTGGSTGLGLAITRAIVNMHGGSIEISNKTEGGASYRIMLPVSHAARYAPTKPPLAK